MTNKPTKPIPKLHATYFVNARQKVYQNSTEIYLPNDPYEKLEEGYEVINPPSSAGLNKTSVEDKIERSTRRAYIAVKDIVHSNTFEMFATFTFKDGRDNPDLCKLRMNGWLKRQRKKDKSFQYLVVPELHHDGVSLHFHAMITGYKGEVTRAYNPHTGKPLNVGRYKRKVYDFPNYTLGHSSLYYIGDTNEDRIRSGFYILKYIKKDMPVFANKKRYWSSRGLNKPIVTENPKEWYFDITPDHVFESDYGKFLYFNNERIKEHINAPNS